MALALALTLGLVACGGKRDCPRCPAGEGAPTGTTPPALANQVQAEMQTLAAAMETAVRGVGTGDVSQVQYALHRVHAARQATEKAIESGAWKPAQNADKLETFVAMDGAFHDHLERLVAASATNDLPGTAAALGDALNACDGCHAMFRAPGPVKPAAAPAQPPAHEH